MEKKQTAVDWLASYIKGITDLNCDEIIEQAKQMEKEQRFQDFKEGFQAALESLQGANNLVQSKKLGGQDEK